MLLLVLFFSFSLFAFSYSKISSSAYSNILLSAHDENLFASFNGGKFWVDYDFEDAYKPGGG